MDSLDVAVIGQLVRVDFYLYSMTFGDQTQVIRLRGKSSNALSHHTGPRYHTPIKQIVV